MFVHVDDKVDDEFALPDSTALYAFKSRGFGGEIGVGVYVLEHAIIITVNNS